MFKPDTSIVHLLNANQPLLLKHFLLLLLEFKVVLSLFYQVYCFLYLLCLGFTLAGHFTIRKVEWWRSQRTI